MSQPDKKFGATEDIGVTLNKGLREIALLSCAAFALFLLIALVTFNLEDPGWTHNGSGRPIVNAAGAVGAKLSDFLLTFLGLLAYPLPVIFAAYSHALFKGKRSDLLIGGLNWLGFILALCAAAALADIHLLRIPISLPEDSGGIIGQELATFAHGAFGKTGTNVVLITLFLAGISLCTGLSWLNFVDRVGKYALLVVDGFLSVFSHTTQHGEPEQAKPAKSRNVARRIAPTFDEPEELDEEPVEIVKPKSKPAEKTAESVAKPAISQPAPAYVPPPAPQPVIVPKKSKPVAFQNVEPGELPSLELLNQVAVKIKGYSQAALEDMSRMLEAILSDFGVEIKVVEVHPGPVITRFEIQPAPGVKVSRISGLAKDLARTLSVTSVRVVEIIPGKSVVGLEIPNEEREMVLLHSVLASSVYQNSESPLTMVLGKDIGGHPVVANLAKMPHLLVAGTTGSGKSVAVNVMILSMLFKATPEEVRMIMIDPKMLELSIYEGIPHLLTPVVTDMKEAANSLRWSVAEMERRYKLMSMLGVRNLGGYNQKVKDAADSGEPLKDPSWSASGIGDEVVPNLEHLPHIVIIIDELADMMMVVGKKVEELIARLAQKARAAGIHLILATQRPSVDVLTGLIKANIPTRLSFQVSSRIDSRTIIDQGGAEALLGNGDMLFLPPGSGLPMRAHGAFVSDQEVHDVVEFLKLTGSANYIDEITRFSEDNVDASGGAKGANGEVNEDLDALYDEAVRFVTETRKASISSVQRRFKVGYNRAARMIEDMENAGIVGPAENTGTREVLAPPPPSL